MKKGAVLLALGVFLCDRLVKVLTNTSRIHGSIGIMHVHRFHNYGATMGIFHGDRLLLVAIGVVVFGSLVVVWFKAKSYSAWFWIGWALLIGGASGNLFDRIVDGYVTDMLQVPFYPAIFNIADVAIRTGLFMMLVAYWFASRRVRGQ